MEHWRERADLVTGHRYWNYLGEDDRGDLLVPKKGEPDAWEGHFNPRKPSHWMPWLRSRLTGRIVMLERTD